jgi:hypothetical protein
VKAETFTQSNRYERSAVKQEDIPMKAKTLTLTDLEKVTGGKLDPEVRDYLNEVIWRAKRADKSLEQCIRDFYNYNKDFNKEQEDYIRDNWDFVNGP